MKTASIIIRIIIIILGIYLAVSCGARKSETTKKEETTKTDFSRIFRNSGNSHEILKSDLNLQTNYSNYLFDLSKSNSYEFSFEPEDKTKPAIYTDPNGQKHIVENGKLNSKKTTEEKNINSGNSGNSQQILKTELEKKSNYIQRLETQIKEIKRLSDKNKKVEKEELSFWNYLLILIPIGLMLIVWNVYKKLNPIS
jgi:hypothetical protein